MESPSERQEALEKSRLRKATWNFLQQIFAWLRRGVQDLLHHGLASGKDASAAISAHPRGDIQRHDHGNRIRQSVGVTIPRPVEHGQADGPRLDLHHDGGRSVSGGADGAAEEIQQVGARRYAFRAPRRP